MQNQTERGQIRRDTEQSLLPSLPSSFHIFSKQESILFYTSGSPCTPEQVITNTVSAQNPHKGKDWLYWRTSLKTVCNEYCVLKHHGTQKNKHKKPSYLTLNKLTVMVSLTERK